MENPYASPEISAEPAPEIPRFSPLAVVVGWLTDIAFSLVVGTVLMISAALQLAMQGITLELLESEVKNMTWVQALGVIGGCCGTMLGGYVAAWMGKSFPLRHGIAVGVLSLLAGLVPFYLFPDAQPLWVSVAGIVLVVPAGLLGGYLRGAHATSKTAHVLVR